MQTVQRVRPSTFAAARTVRTLKRFSELPLEFWSPDRVVFRVLLNDHRLRSLRGLLKQFGFCLWKLVARFLRPTVWFDVSDFPDRHIGPKCEFSCRKTMIYWPTESSKATLSDGFTTRLGDFWSESWFSHSLGHTFHLYPVTQNACCLTAGWQPFVIPGCSALGRGLADGPRVWEYKKGTEF